jgi:hypothetical protein
MRRKLVVGALVATVVAFAVVGVAAAAPDNKNSQIIPMMCESPVGPIVAVTIEHNNAGGLNIVAPGHGTYEIKRVEIDEQVVYQNPGFAGRDLVECSPADNVTFGGILNMQR